MARFSLLVIVILLFLASPAGAVTLQGKFLQSCTVANNAQVDPLVSPGGVADHPHTEAGSTTFTSTSTTADFLNSPTTCIIPGNHSAYWTSAMQKADGTLVNATYASGYYGGFGSSIPVHLFPLGLRFVTGNSKSTTLQSTSIIQWRCDAAGNPTRSAPPTTCPAGVGVELMFVTPPCWDGMTLDAPDHKSNMAYGVAGGTCPASHPIRVPQLNWSFHFPTSAVGACPASDHGIGPCGRSAHMDSWFAEDEMQFALLNQCVNDPARNSASSPLCGLFTYRGGGLAPSPTAAANGWLANLNAWAGKVDYIANPLGNPATRTAP